MMAAESEKPVAPADGGDQQQQQQQQANGSGEPVILGKKSPGVMRVEVISSHMTFVDRILLFIGIFILAYAYGLDGGLRFTYQVYT